jgi:phosphoglycolate phosphatase-like HAD superfamily hydrolase
VTLDQLDGVTHAVMVGDTPYDAESAAKAGMKCIGLRSGGYSEAELLDGGVVLVADTPGDLIDVDWEKYLSVLG